MIEIKADGQAEMRLLELLYPAPSALPAQPGSVLVAAETQRRIDDLTYLVQTQQAQLEQAQLALNDYQQSFALLRGSTQAQPMLAPAAPDNADRDSAASSISRRYITGGLGRGDTSITVSSQTSPITAQVETKHPATRTRWRPPLWPIGRPRRLTRIGLILTLSAATGWGVFKYVAPPVGNWLFPEPTTSISEPTKAPESAKEPATESTPEPQSNLSSETATPGSAANKAGTLPAIPTAPPAALEQAK